MELDIHNRLSCAIWTSLSPNAFLDSWILSTSLKKSTPLGLKIVSIACITAWQFGDVVYWTIAAATHPFEGCWSHKWNACSKMIMSACLIVRKYDHKYATNNIPTPSRAACCMGGGVPIWKLLNNNYSLAEKGSLGRTNELKLDCKSDDVIISGCE